jgi:drug/metabolite transporter (DMT)-like permease
MAMFAAVTRVPFDLGPNDLPLLVILGAIVAMGFALFYMALQIGPVSVVSSITATSGAASVVFAVVLLGEHPSPLQWVAVPISTVGAVLATRARRVPGTVRGPMSLGPLYAAATVLTAGASNALIRIPIVEHGPIQAVVVQRCFTVAFLVLLVAGTSLHRRRRARSTAQPTATGPTPRHRGGRPGTVALLLAMAAIDATGFIGFAFGMSLAPAWLLGLVSQSGRLVAAFVANAVFRDKLRPIQWVGIGLVAVGLVLAVLP